MTVIARFKEQYNKEIVPDMMKAFSYSSIMQVPKLSKITLNMGLGGAITDKKLIEIAVAEMTRMSGQKPVVNNARKSVASFKLREGWPIGCKVTLRKEKMYEFLDRLISIYLTRVRDFRGLNPKSFDGRGNYSLGITEQIVCPEIDYDTVDSLHGFDVTITTTAKTDDEACYLLRAFKFPLKESKKEGVQ